MITFGKLQLIKVMTRLLGDQITGCLLDYYYFEKYFKLIAIDLSKQQRLDADPRAIQQINFTGNLNQAEGATIFFITDEAKETILNFSKGILKFF